MTYDISAIRRAFGILFIGISIVVGLSASLTEIAFIYLAPNYLYFIIWIGIPAGTILAFKLKYADMFRVIAFRFRQSVTWPFRLKLINGICWAAPFAFIAVFPNYYSYLILLGIGLGNTSTFLIMRKVSDVNFYEHLIVGLVSLVALPIVMGLDSLHILSTDLLGIFTRLFIAFAYGAGGTYTLTADTL